MIAIRDPGIFLGLIDSAFTATDLRHKFAPVECNKYSILNVFQ